MPDVVRRCPRLRLRLIPKACREGAREAFGRGDVPGFFLSASNEASMGLLIENADAFRAAGLYERALLDAYAASRINNAALALDLLEALFKLADRDRLRALGDPLPPGDRFTLYRGVAGVEPYRKEAGYSWTSSPGIAARFARRGEWFGFPDPAVLVTEARAEDVLAYLNASMRNEDDFLYLASKWERVEPMPEPAPLSGGEG